MLGVYILIKKLTLIVLIVLLLAIILQGIACAANSTLYVDVNLGNDSNDGSQSHPWNTINHAATQVEIGDTVLISNGNYFIHENIQITTSGTENNAITFRGAGDGVVIDGSGLDGSSYNKRDAIFVENADYVNIENLEIKNAFRAGIRVSESDYVTITHVKSHDNGNWGIFTGFSNNLKIENCECYGSVNEHGIYTSNSGDNPIIRGNIIYDNHGCGLHMNGDISMGGDGVISNALVENNIIYNNGLGGGSGINCDGVVNSMIRNNLLFNNHSSGISLYCIDGGSASNNNQVYHNTVIVASDGRWALNIKDGSSQNKIYNNILLNNNPNRGSICTDSITGLESDFNIITTNSHPVSPDDESTYPSFSQWQVMGFDQHSTQTNSEQLFTNALKNDYTLKNGSLAVDRGTSQHACFMDMKGISRPQGNGYDIGAFEKAITQPSDLVYVTSTNPAQYAVNLPANQIFTVTFSKPIIAANLNLIILKTSTGTIIPTTKTINNNMLTITPNNPLTEAKYLLLLYAGCVKDVTGNLSIATTRTYGVGAQPYVTTTNPTNYAVNVPRNKIITATFNEPLQAKYLTLIYLKTATTGILVSITPIVSGNTLTITPTSPLAANTRYMLLIYTFAVTDLAGNSNVNKAISFTTGAI